ncbi:hypothetical protein RV18_GL001669 [Enterococcus termitis]|nr:hypothetical protein RV18_GL001669 [Enterococcus termitis]
MLTILVSCKPSKNETHSNEYSLFDGTWEVIDNPEQRITITENDKHSFDLSFENLDFLESSDLIVSEQTRKELILKSKNKGLIYSFYIIEKNQLDFYFAANSDENIVGESPPITLKKTK